MTGKIGDNDFLRQLGELDEALEDWRRYRDQYSLRELLDNRDIRNMVLYAILVTIQAAIRAAHYLIIENYLPKPGTYAETFVILRKAGLLEDELTDQMVRLSMYRQQLVQYHHQVDLREIYQVLSDDLAVLEKYRRKLEKHMSEKYKDSR